MHGGGNDTYNFAVKVDITTKIKTALMQYSTYSNDEK